MSQKMVQMNNIHKSTQFLVQKHVECSALGIQQTQKRHIQKSKMQGAT